MPAPSTTGQRRPTIRFSTIRFSTIRFRITALAALVATAVLGSSAVAVVVVQRQQLAANFDRSLEQRADQLVGSLAVDGATEIVGRSSDSDRAAQLVDVDGSVVVASPNLAGQPPIADPPPADRPQVIRTSSDIPIEDDSYRVLSRRIELGGSAMVLHVAENVDDLTDATRSLAVALGVGVPVVIAVMTGLVWWLVGRTLRPVEAIRSEVTTITGSDLDRRVTVPPDDDEIGRLASTMNDMLDRLSRASEQQRRFVSDASHELRTPLTRMRAELEVDLERPDRADLVATHRALLEETVTLGRLVDDLLLLARSDAAATPLRLEPLDLDDIVIREVRRLRARSPLEVDTRHLSAAHVVGDGDQLRRVVRNLLDNAARHATDRVSVSLVEEGETAVLTVGDDGPGIPAGAEEAIFERFARLDDARTRSDGGTGLGLAICRDIVVDHGGTIAVADEGVGARFVVRLPVAGPQAV